MSSYHKIATTGEIKEGEIRSFIVDNEVVAVCNSGGRFYAFKDQCSHQDLPLSDGELDGDVVRCAYHGAEFDIKSGEALCLPAVEPVETYSIKIENGDILISLD